MSALFDLLNPYRWLLLAGLCAALWAAYAWRISVAEEAGYDRARTEIAAAQERAREANRLASRAAEEKERERVVYRTRVITKIEKDLNHATAPLADCRLPAAAVRVLNDAASRARENRPAADSADAAVHDAS